MTIDTELEDALRNLAEDSGLSCSRIAAILADLADEFKIRAEDEGPE